MKRNDLKQELRRLSVNDLQAKLTQYRKELCSLRLNAATAHVKDYSHFKKLRSTIALVQTLLKQAIA